MEQIPKPDKEIEKKLGWVSLKDIVIEQWWQDFGTPYELPKYGVEILGKDF